MIIINRGNVGFMLEARYYCFKGRVRISRIRPLNNSLHNSRVVQSLVYFESPLRKGLHEKI